MRIFNKDTDRHYLRHATNSAVNDVRHWVGDPNEDREWLLLRLIRTVIFLATLRKRNEDYD